MNEFSTRSLSVAVASFPAAQRIFDSETFLIGVDNMIPETDEEKLNLLYDPILQNLNEIGITSEYHLRDEVLFFRNDVYYVALQFLGYLFPSPLAKQAYADVTIRRLVLSYLDRLEYFDLGTFFMSLYQFPLIRGSIDIPFEEHTMEEFFECCTNYLSVDAEDFDSYMNSLIKSISPSETTQSISPPAMALLKAMRNSIHYLIDVTSDDTTMSTDDTSFKKTKVNVIFNELIMFLGDTETVVKELPGLIRNRVVKRYFQDYPGDVPITADLFVELYFWYIATQSETSLVDRLPDALTALGSDLEAIGINRFGQVEKSLNELARTLQQSLIGVEQ